MPLETAQYIDSLNPANPLGSDPVAFVDDHIRLIKSTLKATFPNLNAPVTLTPTQLNGGVQKTGDTMSGPLVLPGNPSSNLQAAPKQYVDSAITSLTTTVNSKASASVTISAGSGLTGGGDLSVNRSLALANTAVTPGSYGSASAIPVITVDSQGRLTGASSVAFGQTSYSLAAAGGASATRSVYLTPGVWQVVLDTRAYRPEDGSNFDVTISQVATVGTTSVSTSIPLYREGGSGHGRPSHGSDIAVGTLTVAEAATVTMAFAAASATGTGSGTVQFTGSILTLEKL